ncbi:universal stress protein [Ramlibacter sp. XY19]|uniref:universal stress protein n=1 Tax=Ramlibacter paludis TaxID=2908000 RepID=UPI0023DC5261|nr:universal stress protein [Ramlibacter paludis]MCG2593849.1 universal stress protein [Ramlibacter paludis]
MSAEFLPLGEVVALVDAGAAGANAAWRAALVARDHRTALRFLHTPTDADVVAALAEEIAARLAIEVRCEALEGEVLPGVLAAARRAGLLVMGARRGNPLRDFIFGTQAERVLRLCRVPVLVVKRRPAAGYRRVLVPVELAPAAGRVIAAAAAFSRDPAMQVLHALRLDHEATMRTADVPEHVVRSLRRRATARAHSVLEEAIARAGAACSALPAVSFGDAARVILARERAMRAELVVLGKRGRGLLADFLLGSVSRRVLAGAGGDVLLMPASA